MSLDPHAVEEIAFLVAQGFGNREDVLEGVLANFPETQNARDELREAVDAAFDDKLRQMASWPAVTDCDRLRNAFDALEREGVVCLECPGLTQDDSVPAAADIAVARDEAGFAETHGYCFFTWNDLARVVLDGRGLSLAYGSFKEESEQSSAAAPAVCPVCKGRGWIAATDPEKFPEVCGCKKAPPSRPTAPARTAGQLVGDTVLAACRAAGLTAEWTGRGEDFVELPGFRWQRRLTALSEQDVLDFLESWQVEIRAGYTPEGDLLELLADRAGDWFKDFSDYSPLVLQRLRARTEQLISDERAREEAWPAATINDRIAAAFDQLGAKGVLAPECLGLTIQDGWGYAGGESSPSTRGVVFFHHEDVIDGVAGRGLLLAFGAIGGAPADEAASSAALAREVVATLLSCGVTASWSGALNERIRIAPFEWQKRRWTKSPAFVPQTPQPEPKRASFISRLFGAKAPAHDAPIDPRANDVARQRALVVRALADERGFNLRRSRRVRESWTALGLAGDAHVAHLGVPHAFIPTGGHTSFVPRRSTENLGGDRDALFARALAGRTAKEN